MKTNLLAALTLASLFVSSAQESIQRTNALKQYDVVQYARISGYGPQNIMLMDNNGDILLACKAGITEENLKTHGVPYTESQLVLLETWRVLSRDNDTLKTVVPILDSTETNTLRNYAKHVAALVCDSTATLVHELKVHLDEIERSRNAYTIMFSYVADNLVWQYLEERKLATPQPRKQLSQSNHFGEERFGLCTAPGHSVAEQTRLVIEAFQSTSTGLRQAFLRCGHLSQILRTLGGCLTIMRHQTK